MSALVHLAERCENATGHDRELDAVIADVVDDQTNCGGGTARYLRSVGNSHHDIATYCSDLRAFTASLDAAMTLLADSTWWSVDGTRNVGFVAVIGDDPDKSVSAHAATPALALCAAALRARGESDQ